MAGALDGFRELALDARGGAGDAPGQELALAVEVLLEEFDVSKIDVLSGLVFAAVGSSGHGGVKGER